MTCYEGLRPSIIMGIDPVGDVPYYYLEHDSARHLARNWGMLDTSADSYEWSSAAALSSTSAPAAQYSQQSATPSTARAVLAR